MTTVEKLFLQIFERKNRIIQQVKQQTDLYHQNLASKLLIDGLDPPLWLWNPNQSSSYVHKGMNKEELISEIFLSRAQPPVGFSSSRCYLYNQSVGQETGEILHGSCKVTHGCNNGDTGAEQSDAAGFVDNNAGFEIDTIPEVEVRVTSPGDETEPRISNIFAAQKQSVVRIQRSKSRQKALELRSSAKSKGKGVTLDGPSAQDRSSFSGNKVADLVNGLEEVAEPFVISSESYKVDKSVEDDSWKKEKEIIVPPGKFNSLRNSATSVMDGLKADCSDYIQGNNFAEKPYSREISRCHVSKNENAATDNCEACKERAGYQGVVKGKYTNTSGGRMLRSSFNQQQSCLNEPPVTDKLNKSAGCKESVLPKLGNDATSCTLREFSSGSAVERANMKTVSCDDGFTIHPYNHSIGARDRSSESGESFAKKIECYSILVDEAPMPCADSRIVTSPRSNFVAVNEDKLMPNDHVKYLILNSMLVSGITRVDCLARTSSDCLRSVDPIQLNFEGTDGCNFNEMSCITSQSRSEESSAKEVFGNSLDPQVSYCDNTRSAQENAPLEGLQESSKKFDCHVGPFESTSEEHVEDHMKEIRFSAIQYTTSQTSQDNLEVLQVQSSTPTDQGNNKSSAFQTSNAENYIGVLLKERNEFSPEFQSREYQSTAEGKEKSAYVPHAQRNYLESNFYGGKEDLVILGSIGSALDDDKDLAPLKAWELQFPEKLQGFSWPPKKRRKIEDHETSSFSALPSFRIPREQMKAINLTINVGDEKELILEQSNPVSNSTDEQIYPKMSSQLTRKTESSAVYRKNESTLISEVLAQHEDTSSSPCSIQGEESILSTSVEEMGVASQGCLMNKLKFVSGTSNIRKDQQKDLVDEDLVNSQGLVDADRTILNGSYTDVDRVSGNLVETAPKMESIGADQIMPVLEGFIMDSDTSNEKVDVSGNGISFDIFELTKTSVERASILEEICKSASTESPFTHISSAFKFQSLHTCHLSMPNGLLESADSKRFSALNGHVDNHIRSKGVDGVKESCHEVSRSHSLPYSKSRYWDSLNPSISPVGKLWEKINSHSYSSGKNLSSNPELTCFPIEEHIDSNEENEDFSVPDRVDNNVDEVVYTCTERGVLADISASHSNGRSVREPDMYACKNSFTTAAAEVKCKPPHNKSIGKGGKHIKSRNEEKENDSLPTGAIEMNKFNYSLNNRYSKISSSYATSSSIEQHKILRKETKQNNTVSNVTSFVPLVQQKQAAALCKGKRDIKVKALEAAEATKRQQEKRDQERKLRKEAAKLERARVEQENLRLTEENKKKKEEERAKKDAEVVAKKRIRAEEERKEKERKKRRIEETRSQRLEEGKLANNKVDKGKQPSVMGGKNKKGANNEVQNSKGFSNEISDHINFEKHDMKLTTNGFTSDVHDEGSSGDSFEHLKVTPAVAKSTENNIAQKIQEKPYEISPYQCSDEEEDEDDVPNKKSIPSWASKRCVASVLPVQQGIEPDVIFPPDSFCSTAEGPGDTWLVKTNVFQD